MPENGVLGLVVLVPTAGNVFYDFTYHGRKIYRVY